MKNLFYKLKKQKLFVFLFLSIFQLNAQNPFYQLKDWSIGGSYLSFIPTYQINTMTYQQTQKPLPTPDNNNNYNFPPYSNTMTGHLGETSNMIYAANNNVLFYVDNDIIYNASGSQISSLLNYNSGYTETSIVPVPPAQNGTTGLEYYVINPFSYSRINFCKDIDQGYYYTDYNMGPYYLPLNPTENNSSNDFLLQPNNPDPGTYLLATSNLITITEGNQNETYRLLFIFRQFVNNSIAYNYLDIYKIENSRISLINYIDLTTWDQNIAYITKHCSEMEVVKAGSMLRLAIPYSQWIISTQNNGMELTFPSLFVADFNQDGTLSNKDIYHFKTLLPLPNQPSQYYYAGNLYQHTISGIEFDPTTPSELVINNNNDPVVLYLSIVPGDVDEADYLHPHNINGGNPEDPEFFGISFLVLQETPSGTTYNNVTIDEINEPNGYTSNILGNSFGNDFSQSTIEIGPDNKMYFAEENELAALDLNRVDNILGSPYYIDNDCWTTIQLNTSIPYVHTKSLNTLQPGRTIGLYLLPDQIDGEDYNAFSNSKVCCSNFTTNYDFYSWDNQEDYNTDWWPNSNPFTNPPYQYLAISPYIILNELIIENSLVINNNVTIHNMTFRFGQNATVTIAPGKTLTLDNTIFTNAICEEMWQGIIVQGQSGEPQTSQYQGSLIMTNNSMIENARRGAHIDPGGIIQAETSIFKNCRKGVEFYPYIINNVDNQSYFKDCDFVCTGPMIDPVTYDAANGTGMDAFVTLWGVSGVKFTNNTFENTAPYGSLYGVGGSLNDIDCRGDGIGSADASFYVQKEIININGDPCPIISGNGNIFTGLSRGIYTGNSNNFNGFLNILGNQFNDVIHPIEVLQNGNNTNIFSNTFTWDNLYENYYSYTFSQYNTSSQYNIGTPAAIGINFNNSTNVKITNNTFTWENQTSLLTQPTCFICNTTNISNNWLFTNNNASPCHSFIGCNLNNIYGNNINGNNNNGIYNQFTYNSFNNNGTIADQYVAGIITNGNVSNINNITPTCNYFNNLWIDWYIGPYCLNNYFYKYINNNYIGIHNNFTQNSNSINIYYEDDINSNPVLYWTQNTNNISTYCFSTTQNINLITTATDEGCTVEICDPYLPIVSGPGSGEVTINMKENNIKTINLTRDTISLYPNPTNNFINISYNLNKLNKFAMVKIYDILGKEVYNHKIENYTGILNINKNEIGAKSAYNIIIMNDKNSIIFNTTLIIE